MVHSFALSFYPVLARRALLLLNHVLAAEPVASQRLRTHSGGCILLHIVRGGSAWLPALPAIRLTITPAGLLDLHADLPAPEADLQVDMNPTNLALVVSQWLTGAQPKFELKGDANLAADLAWVVENLRWDVQDDLARIVGMAGANEVARLGCALRTGLHRAAGVLSVQIARAPAGAPAPASQ